jgi:dienelactone hydrolase
VTAKKRILQSVDSERTIDGGSEIHLSYRIADGHPVPAVLTIPDSAARVPAALLLHGYSSRKEVMAGAVGRALLAHGMASLAIDLPLHGTRADPVQAQSARNPLHMMQLWRQGIDDARLGIRYLQARANIDSTRIAIVGYSMGAFLSVVIAADEPAIKAVVVAAGGDLPQDTPLSAIARMVADPLRAVRRLEGRPLLIVHGKRDRTVKPEQAQRLFDAAHEPKEIRWWDAGHHLPYEASDQAAAWLQQKLRDVRRETA